jgi:hypothetical protein
VFISSTRILLQGNHVVFISSTRILLQGNHVVFISVPEYYKVTSTPQFIEQKKFFLTRMVRSQFCEGNIKKKL